ncbi:hypothetical protein ACWDTT_21995 [Streptosporangium sandarakinum]|uniref:hypothetical protein n=1 Tax=Streptosporangium sandarakinum TaxID=1260955 RepID=UPI003D91CE02
MASPVMDGRPLSSAEAFALVDAAATPVRAGPRPALRHSSTGSNRGQLRAWS